MVMAVVCGGGTALSQPSAKRPLTDDDLRQILIQQSIDAYPGNCPCPYNVDRAGRACGGRSAWSRGGGRAPYCYPKDVPQREVDELRARLANG